MKVLSLNLHSLADLSMIKKRGKEGRYKRGKRNGKNKL
jgi:hypothetical protein